MKRTLVILSAIVALVGFMAVRAQADTISTITITDSVTFNTGSLATATQATFGPVGQASGTTGVYSGLAGDSALISSPSNVLSWSPTAITSGEAKWAINSFTFDVTSGVVGYNNTTGVLSMSGDIALHTVNLGNVTGTYQLSYTLLDAQTHQGGYTLSVKYDQAVPEPATLLLLGIGLLGLGLVGLKWKRKA